MRKKMSRKAKVILIIVIIAVLGAVTALIIIKPWDKPATSNQNNGNNNGLTSAVNALPNEGALRSLFSRLEGYWVSGSQFVGFSRAGRDLTFEYGLLQSGFGVSGQVTGANVSGNNAFSLELFIEAREATEMDEARPERTETVYVDISNYGMDNRINVKIQNLGDGEWHTYNFSGRHLMEVN